MVDLVRPIRVLPFVGCFPALRDRPVLPLVTLSPAWFAGWLRGFYGEFLLHFYAISMNRNALFGIVMRFLFYCYAISIYFIRGFSVFIKIMWRYLFCCF